MCIFKFSVNSFISNFKILNAVNLSSEKQLNLSAMLLPIALLT